MQKLPSTQDESESETQRKRKTGRRTKFKEKQDRGKIVIKILRKPKLALNIFLIQIIIIKFNAYCYKINNIYLIYIKFCNTNKML